MLNRVLLLAISDWKNIKRDPLLIFALLAPLLLAVLARIGLPQLDEVLNQYTSFHLSEHFRIVVGLVLLMAPLMIGTLFGFILLDERDEGILLYYSVTPLTKAGYLYGRLLVPMVFTFILTLVMVFIQGIVQLNTFAFIPVAFLFALQTPITTLLMATLASNKVEGMALTKVINLCILAPVIDYVFANPIVKIVIRIHVRHDRNRPINRKYNDYWFPFFIGIMITFLWFMILTQKFQKKIG